MTPIEQDALRRARCAELLRCGLELLVKDPEAGQGPDFIGVINEVSAEVAKEVRAELGPEAMHLIESLEAGAVGLQVAWEALETLELLAGAEALPAALRVRPPPGAFRVGVFLADGSVRTLVLQEADPQVPADGGGL